MYPIIELWKLHLLFEGNKNSATPDRKNHVEMYSSPNAPAQGPKERAQLASIQYIQHMINFLMQKLQKRKKIQRT